MVREWFSIQTESSAYNDFVKALLLDDVDYINEFMNEIALEQAELIDGHIYYMAPPNRKHQDLLSFLHLAI